MLRPFGKVSFILRPFGNGFVCCCATNTAFSDCVKANPSITVRERRNLNDALKVLYNPNLVEVDRSVYAFWLKECSKLKALDEGKKLHACIRKSRYANDKLLCNLLINMYAKCGSLQDAQGTFDAMLDRDVASWTSLISAYAIPGYASLSLRIFEKMVRKGVRPNKITFMSLLRACASSAALQKGKRIHALIISCGLLSDIHIGTALINMYSKCDSLENAKAVFDAIPEHNVVSWSAMLTAYSDHGYGRAAIQLFRRMLESGVDPNKVTFMSLLKACASLEALEEGKHIHKLILDANLHFDNCLATCLMKMYAKCGEMGDARRVFDEMPERDVVSWTAMIVAYAGHGQLPVAFELFEKMMQDGIKPDKVTLVSMLNGCVKPDALNYGKSIHAYLNKSGLERDIIVENALLNMYVRCKSVGNAIRIFEQMPNRDTASWSAMITAHIQLAFDERGFKLLGQMQLDGIEPTGTILATILNACAAATALEEGKVIHNSIVKSGLQLEVGVGTALVNMYGKCGGVDDARAIFDKISNRDVVTWTTMIAVYSDNGNCTAALRLFWQMQSEGITLDRVILITVLNACRNPGYLEEGKLLHALILKSKFATDIVVGNSLISMFGMCGSLRDAQEVFDNMPERDVVSWNALIGIFAQYEKGSMALKHFEHMQEEGMKPDKITFLSILDACASLACLAEGKLIHEHILQNRLESDIEVESALVSMYGRCGSIKDAHSMFSKIYERDLVAWNALAAAYAWHGNEILTFQVIGQMQWEGSNLDDISLLNILSACNHAGLVDEGWHYVASMPKSYCCTAPSMEHHIFCYISGQGPDIFNR